MFGYCYYVTSSLLLTMHWFPGGESYAQYQNIMTQVKVLNTGNTLKTGVKAHLVTGFSTGTDELACAGPCLGACALVCKEATQVKAAGGLSASLEVGGELFANTRSESNSFSTTWSYKTSTDAAKAGADSDVFVVPNLNVMFTPVFIVLWDNDTCKPIRNDDDEGFPEEIVFDIGADTTKPALSFYSRYHIDRGAF